MKRIAASLKRNTSQPSGNETGASLVEYALLVALIAMVCVGAVTAFGGSTNDAIGSYNECMEAPESC